MARRRLRARRRFVLTPGILLILVLGLLAVWLGRTDRLPEPLSVLVREAEVHVLGPVLRELGIEVPYSERPPVVPEHGFDADHARTALARISIEPERKEGYEREAWPHWLDLDSDCLDTREEVLVAESLEPTRLSRDGCRVLGGRWLDRYTGETITDPSALDVDHVVALEEAHRSGGHAWSRERRAAFANDLSDPRTLVAVSSAANRAKGSQGPEDWLPPEPRSRCRYVVDWILIKARWELSMDERERVTVGNILEACVAAGSTTSSVTPRSVR